MCSQKAMVSCNSAACVACGTVLSDIKYFIIVDVWLKYMFHQVFENI